VVLQGELAEGVFDRLAVGVFRNTKNLVIVALGGCDDDSFIMNLLALKKRLNRRGRGGRRGVQSQKLATKNSPKIKNPHASIVLFLGFLGVLRVLCGE
jgi:hypothetical protein